jgi:glycosyltransferase involved in cell wall biosynthesis
MLGEVYRRAREFDVIHCHTTYLGLPLTSFTTTPTVLTHHGRLDIREQGLIFCAYPQIAHISISGDQRQFQPGMTWAATVYHGLPLDLYPFQSSQATPPFLLFLGRISPEKRPDSAIRIACQAGLPLRIAAKVDPVDQAYFETTIRPLLDHPLIEFIGEVNEEQKRVLLGDALALLFPIDWPEPFGLVMIEALACGTPVIARRRGSVPEILQEGVTGFVCDTEEEMVGAVQKVTMLKREACRRAFVERFSVQRMAHDYITVYEAYLEHGEVQRVSMPQRARAGLLVRPQHIRPELSAPESPRLLSMADSSPQSLTIEPLSSAVIARST